MERIEHTYVVPIDIQSVWSYFIQPKHLKDLEPVHHQFKWMDEEPEEKAFNGMRLLYEVTPVPGVTILIENVFSEIEAPYFYVTEIVNQLFEYWRFEHFFRPLPNGHTEVKDVIYFKPIPGELGKKIDMLITRKEIMHLLRNRESVLRKNWNVNPDRR